MKKFKDSFVNFSYGIGNLAFATVSQTEANYIMFFGTSILGISGTLMGLIVAVSVCWDALSDPIIGNISDNFKGGIFGKRHLFILIGILGMSTVNLLIWQISPGWSMWLKCLLVFGLIMLLETFNSLFSNPHAALGIELAETSEERTKVMSIKSVFFIIGMLMPSLLLLILSPKAPPPGTVAGGLSFELLVKMSYLASIICLSLGLICFFGTIGKAKKNPYEYKTKKKIDVWEKFSGLFKNKNKRYVVIAYSISMLSSAFLTASGLHMFTYSFHFSSTQISYIMLITFGSAIISQPFWVKMSKKKGHLPSLITATRTTIVGALLLTVVFIFAKEFTTFLFISSAVCLSICGFGIGALFSLPFAIYGDIIVEENKSDDCATDLGFLSLAFKFANAFGLLISGILMDFIKFNPLVPVQSVDVQNKLSAVVIVGIVGSLVLSLVFYKKTKLSEKIS